MGTTAEKLAYLQETKAAIKAKLIEKGVTVSDVDTFRSYADKLDEIKGSGGEDVEAINDRLDVILGEVVGENQYTVTFIDADGSTLCSVVVVEGDDCVDPVNEGLISKPTKESTAQYTYSYSGWGLSTYGTVDKTLLKNVTSDKTVYAVYKQSVRSYTVRFYDGDTLIKTEQVVYGKSSDYTYSKEHYIFNGWSPEPTNITGDVDCYAQLEEAHTFADASWEYIADVSARGVASQVFAVGDTKTISYDGYTRRLIIADIGYDYIDEERGTNSITILSSEVFESCKFGKSSGNNISWHEGELGTTINSTIYNKLPTDLKSVIKPAYKKYRAKIDGAETMVSEYFPLWALSAGEIKQEIIVGSDDDKSAECDERHLDRPYALFTDATARKKMSMVNNNLWLRTYYFLATDAFVVHIENNSFGFTATIEREDAINTKRSVMFGFCV